jgi:membrane-associated protease RseP (regulator of RpoE activity)
MIGDGSRPRLWRHVLLFGATAAMMILIQGWPFAVAMLAILVAHESGHYLSCRRYGIEASLPYFIPAPNPFGTFGAFIRIRSPFPHRDALFDVGAAGPWAGFVVALPVMVIGLARSTITTIPPEPLSGIILGESLLIRGLTRTVLGPLPAGADVLYDPVALAGWAGLLVTTLNLLPAGQLDGGHVLYAAGLRSRLFSLLPVAAATWLAWAHSPVWALWAGLLLLMAVLGHPPTMNDARPLSPARRAATVLTLLLLAVTFMPDPIGVIE